MQRQIGNAYRQRQTGGGPQPGRDGRICFFTVSFDLAQDASAMLTIQLFGLA